MAIEIQIKPQHGPQEQFLTSPADIAIYGGAAGSGKSYALLLEALYNVSNPLFRAILFRRTVPQLKLPGGLLDTAEHIYTQLGATANQTALEFRFPAGAVVKLAAMEHPSDRFNYQGAQVPLLMFDELSQFSSDQFWYLLSRNRSVSGVRATVRGTTNPDCDSWLRTFLRWWIDDDTGLPIKSRSGVLRWFVRLGDELTWADTPEELIQKFGIDAEPKSATFIAATIHDNQILLQTDKSYLSNLKALPRIDRERLLSGNWNIRAEAGSYFRREWFTIVDCAPRDVVGRVRFWDRAASEQKPGTDPDASVGLLLSKDSSGVYYIENMVKMFATPRAVEKSMQTCASQDGIGTVVAYAQDPASAGRWEAMATATALDGYNVRFAVASGSKEVRAKPISAQCEAGNVRLVRGLWNEEFLREIESFPVIKHDDCVDALSGAHEFIATPTGAFTSEIIAALPNAGEPDPRGLFDPARMELEFDGPDLRAGGFVTKNFSDLVSFCAKSWKVTNAEALKTITNAWPRLRSRSSRLQEMSGTAIDLPAAKSSVSTSWLGQSLELNGSTVPDQKRTSKD